MRRRNRFLSFCGSRTYTCRRTQNLRNFHIRRGAHTPSSGAPAQSIDGDRMPEAVAILGEDYPGLRPKFAVETGARVAEGQLLFSDRKHPEIVFVSPVRGVVEEISFGPRRRLSVCVISVDRVEEDAGPPSPLGSAAEANPRALLMSRGLWSAFRSRPFGRIPGPLEEPAAIFVNAVHRGPDAPDPRTVLEGRAGDFLEGVRLLTRLTQGTIHVCQSPGATLGPDLERVHHTSFTGTAAAALPGTQIDRLHRHSARGPVWTIGYQDVAAIGHLIETGRSDHYRVISVVGPALETPRIVRTRLGARLADIAEVGGLRLFSGDKVTGHEARYLGRFHDCITVLAPRRKRHGLRFARPESQTSALIPTRAIGTALAPDLPTVPLLRALSVGDAGAADRLGCRALIEEDVALLSERCTSGQDYGALLRRILDDLADAVA